MATLEENINQAISDFDDIEAAIVEQGVEVPDGTDTKEYGNLIRSIPKSSGGSYELAKYEQSNVSLLELPILLNNGPTITENTVISGGAGTSCEFGFQGKATIKISTTSACVIYVDGVNIKSIGSNGGTLSWTGEVAEKIKLSFPSSNECVVTFNTFIRTTYTDGLMSGEQAEKLENVPAEIKSVTSPDKDGNKLDIYSMESGTYILNGKFSPYPNATSTFTFSSGQLVAIRHGTVSTVAQVFYPPNNAIQYLDIRPDTESETGYSYTRQDAKLVNMESITNKVTALDENVTDEQYPSAKAVWDSLELKRIESLDTENMKYLRDIENGYYILHGYFKPFPNSDSTVIMDTLCVSVAREADGSHLMAFSPLNFKILMYEILVDDTAENGFVFNSWRVKLWDLEPLPQKVADLETQIGDIETLLGGI